jgi:uncharacterized protein (DUF362 family)
VTDLAAARPIDLAVIDGIWTCAGGEGAWQGNPLVRPGVLVVGRNPVNTDAVSTAVMGYDPRAKRGTPPFRNCDNVLELAEGAGLGSADLGRIDVRGERISSVKFDFESHVPADRKRTG